MVLVRGRLAWFGKQLSRTGTVAGMVSQRENKATVQFWE
jgi:hypothetical protein